MLTALQINFLNQVCPNRWTETNDVIAVNDNVTIVNILTKIPVEFGYITGNFICNHNKLTTLYGVGSIIDMCFLCNGNYITTLKHGPEIVNAHYFCDKNQLTNLIGAPKICNANFGCESNQLTSLEGCPRIIKYNLYCSNNPALHILYGLGRVEHQVEYDNCNDLNEWIIEQARRDIFVSYADIAKWVKQNNKFECLLNAPNEIRQYISNYIFTALKHKLIYA